MFCPEVPKTNILVFLRPQADISLTLKVTVTGRTCHSQLKSDVMSAPED